MENIITHFWDRNKIVFKSFWIGFLLLLLLIPTAFIRDLVAERQQRQQTAVTEINSRWAGAQTMTGPVIGVPYIETVTEGGTTRDLKRWTYFLPARLDVQAHVTPETRYRGIYKVIVYTTEMQVRANFDSLHLAEVNVPAAKMLWNEAAVFFDLSDLQGLKEEVILHLSTRASTNAGSNANSSPSANAGSGPNIRGNAAANTADLELAPGKFSTDQFKNALSAALPAWLAASAEGPLELTTTVRLKGSGNLSFVPTGKETRVEASSPWPDPSFTGGYLPDLRTIKDNGFVADWRVLALNRKFPQQWKADTMNLTDAAFGVNLLVPVDTYQQTTRCVKYAILIILLTFTAFFLIEWIYQRPIHSLQYVLVGFALCLFYTLLLSFSEYTGFNAAYGIAAIATIGLITWYVSNMLRSGKMSLFILSLLSVQYGFIFTLLQLQDYALLLGSVGLFITLALVMYFSGKIKWNS
jgi:inner membrane protein